MKQFYFVVFYSFFNLSGYSQSLKEIYNKSVQCYQNKDFIGFLNTTKQLDSLRPSHPTYTYNLACAYALNNKIEESITALKKCLVMNNSIAFENEIDLENIKKSEKYASLLTLQSELANPVISSKKALVLSERDLHPEGLLYLKKSKQWLATSIRNRKIVSFDSKTGKCSNWFTDASLYSVFAIKADNDEKSLWVTSTAIPEMKGFEKDIEGKSVVLKIDIKTKKIEQRFELIGNHVFGDLVIDKTGNVFVSDSGEATIFKITNNSMEVWLDLKKEAFNLQGLTFNDKESVLFVADYLKGILKINRENPSDRNWLAFPENATSKGIDGLLWNKKSLFAVHNGVKPIRIVQYLLNDKNEIASFKIVDNNRPEFEEPALATINDNKLFFFSNAPWKAYTKEGVLDETVIDFPTLFSYQLP
ncbi:TPR end-of-group domain-containing protein [Flavobacterium sp. GCM10027622]|uniref:TPR end-of-group domain-containing protein n=1 Tax=unclassified Flavobacterium TaxID=196869 RepID=UPI0036105752